MTEKEKIIREKALSYSACFSDTCPLREHCLCALIRPYIPKDPYVATSINLSNPKMQKEGCPMYRSDQPVRMPYGLSDLYHDMPGWMERAVKHAMIARYSRKRYYEYHNGTRPLTPDVEQYLRHLLRIKGWQQEPKFIGYIEEYVW